VSEKVTTGSAKTRRKKIQVEGKPLGVAHEPLKEWSGPQKGDALLQGTSIQDTIKAFKDQIAEELPEREMPVERILTHEQVPHRAEDHDEFIAEASRTSGAGERLRKSMELQKLKEDKLRFLEQKRGELKELPHKYGFKFYKWQRDFLECRDKDVFLTAANQTGKSTIQIAKAIEWAGNKALWPTLWPGKKPRQMWYLYPSSDFATSEFKTKWIPDLLPRGSMATHPEWGWKVETAGRSIHAIHFNSGMSIYFKFYTQDISHLQGSTVSAVFCDEELPTDYWDEINFRRMAMNGYFSMCFTATLGQKLWFDVMERQGLKEEKFPDAKKFQISMYQCREFEDGTKSHIDDIYIARAISLCKSEAEVQKRVMGRFASDSGLKYASFDRIKNMIAPIPVPKNHWIYVGVDLGGGADKHPSSITLVAVNPEYTSAMVFDAWVGNDGMDTTSLDVYEKMMSMLSLHDAFDRLGGIFYDYNAVDFATISIRKGTQVMRADKSHATGEQVLNVLFKNQRLQIFDMPGTEQLVFELTTLRKDTSKRIAVDDATDSLRYALTRVPFDWTKIGIEGVNQSLAVTGIPVPTREDWLAKDRRAGLQPEAQTMTIEQELEGWGELYNEF